jgi:large conductance mechanosensitive channel
MLKEFKTFIMRGNVVDLAVAVIVANAFSAIVDSLISDVITPLLLKPAMTALHVDKLSNLGWSALRKVSGLNHFLSGYHVNYFLSC